MGPEDRDRRFEKALARHLRSAAPGRFCPDAEILSAYHERSLLPREMDLWKEHISGCAHCQTVLAQLEATEGIPLQAGEIDEALQTKEAEPVEAAQSLETFAAAAPSRGQAHAAAAVAKPRVSRLYAGARSKWLAPAGAIAAGLLVWIALHENQSFTNPNSAEIKVTSNPPAAPPTPLPSLQDRGSSPKALPSHSASRSEGRELALAKPQLETKVLKKHSQIAEFAEKAPTQKLSDATNGERKDLDQSVSQLSQSIEARGDLDAKVVGGAAQDKLHLQARGRVQTPASPPEGGPGALAQDQAVSIQAQNQVNANAAPVPGPAAMGQVETTGKMKAVAPAKPAQPAAPARNELYASRSMMEVASISNPRLISAPASNVVWRVGRAGLIEFSGDGGNSWSRQTSGVSVDLLAGSAPSETVCWVVGRAGSILLTTDGGAHWKTVVSPLSEDLGGALATDALRAKIWNIGKTRYFETTDGGATWTRVASH